MVSVGVPQHLKERRLRKADIHWTRGSSYYLLYGAKAYGPRGPLVTLSATTLNINIKCWTLWDLGVHLCFIWVRWLLRPLPQSWRLIYSKYLGILTWPTIALGSIKLISPTQGTFGDFSATTLNIHTKGLMHATVECTFWCIFPTRGPTYFAYSFL